MVSRWLLGGCVLLVSCSGVSGPPTPTNDRPAPGAQFAAATARPVYAGLDSPVAIAFRPAADIPYVVEQAGRIRAWKSGGWRTFLDIRGRVLSGGERGLLGLAFDPNFRTNRRFYVMYTDGQGDLRVSRFVATADGSAGRASSEVVLLDITHRAYSNHNGGQLAFDENGFLVIGTGDGGSEGGPNGYAQSTRSLLGKILRIAPGKACGGRPYCVPAKNPFVVNGRRSEILHLGLRNPWRFWIGPSGRTFIGDVGQSAREEVSVIKPGVVGRNLGWDCREGRLNTVASYGGGYCAGRSFTPPVHEYSHSGGRCAITGGAVVGDAGSLAGRYLFADYCTGEVFALRWANGAWRASRILDHGGLITSFGRDPNGRVFFVDSGGGYYRIEH